MAMKNDLGLGESWQLDDTSPRCPECHSNYDVYCMECETHVLDCSCYTIEFYCGGCHIDFPWSSDEEDIELVLSLQKELMREKRIDKVYEDELPEIRIDPPLSAHEVTLIRTNNCNECGESEIKHTHHNHGEENLCGPLCFDWAPLSELSSFDPNDSCPNCYKTTTHECVDARTGEIISWNLKETSTCKCSPEKLYFCSPCNVHRLTPKHPWRDRNEALDSHIEDFLQKQLGDNYDGPIPMCYCPQEPAYFCGHCQVTRSTPDKEWTALEGHKAAMQARRDRLNESVDKRGVVTSPGKQSYVTKGNKVPYSYGVNDVDGWNDYDGWTGLNKCRHYGQPVELLDKTIVHCSSLWDVRKEDTNQPDRGLYFDWSWKPEWRSELSLWPDFGAPANLEATANAIIDHYDMAKKGLAVELGCIGGHGRTGTALACMYILTGASPTEAGQLVRSMYCREAIESQAQVWYLTWFDAYVNKKPLPEKPAYKTPVSTVTSFCSISDHYTQWMANPGSVRCTKRKSDCKSFFDDLKKFKEGKIDKWVVKNALDIKTTSDFNNIDGFLVPKSKIGERSHNKNDKSCPCDYCRYIAKGYGAFLDPMGVTGIHVNTPTGIVYTDVTPEFTPQPPREDGVDLGDIEGQYTWMDNEGTMVWVWDGIKHSKQKYMKANVERNKAKSEAIKGSANKTASSLAEAVVESETQSIRQANRRIKSLLDVEERVYSKKRNKKNPGRGNGRRRKGKNRR